MLQATPKKGVCVHRRHRALLGDARYAVRDILVALIAFAALLAAVGWTALPVKTPNQPVSPAISDMSVSDISSVYTEYSQHLFGAAPSVMAAISREHAGSQAWYVPQERMATVAMLAVVFATIIAFSLWFLRHLGHVYASPWPGHRRREPGGRFT